MIILIKIINPTKNEKIAANNEEGRIFNDGEMMYELAMKIKVKIVETDKINRTIIADLVM